MLEELSQTIRETALCGLGQAAVQPRFQYAQATSATNTWPMCVDQHCPICNGARRRIWQIDPEKCKGCGKCTRQLPDGRDRAAR